MGRLLAQRLGRPLFDLDALVEQECGERIPALFARYGEEYFRDCESRVLARAAGVSAGAVIVTGGGAVVRAENRALMATHGVRIFAHVEPQVALQRLQEQHARELAAGQTLELRPLLSGPDPLATLQKLFSARLAWYQEAELTCFTTGKSAPQVAQEMIAMLIGSGNLDGVAPIVRHIRSGSEYDAVVDWGGIGRLGAYLARLSLPPRIFLVTDSTIHDLYAETITRNLVAAGFTPHIHIVPAGEASKSSAQLNAIYDWLVDLRAERREALIALGGGVVGDLVGYAAATYLRGVPLIHVPTSLLAQVDSSIGGKTGINHPQGKNLIGAFYHPRLVLADPAALLTLPERSRTEGWAEVVKYGIILDAELFDLLEEHADALRDFSQPSVSLLCQIIARCIDLKAGVIEEDEREQGRRAILNYGHTAGHALENASGYGELLHGEAVSLGMVIAGTLAQQAGMWTPAELARQNRLLTALGLPTEYHGPVRAAAILATMQLDKKVVGKRVRWIMPTRIGEVVSTPLADELVVPVLQAFFAGEEA